MTQPTTARLTLSPAQGVTDVQQHDDGGITITDALIVGGNPLDVLIGRDLASRMELLMETGADIEVTATDDRYARCWLVTEIHG